jgi:HEAT repeat protein
VGNLESLLALLLDRQAPLSDRDDAAMDLGRYSDQRVIEALATVATDSSEDATLQASAGESLAERWLASGGVDRAIYKELTPVARTEVDALLRRSPGGTERL